ncbi:ABC transporter permease [Herbiconiux sp. 11R-BC]|uniref:ABC transporter permease n=1 Tax=Herbiconiux sp. 11R-BC TaxID=3111637 RepID=UPI003C03D656
MNTTSPTTPAPPSLRVRAQRLATASNSAFPYVALALIFVVMSILLHDKGFLNPTNLLNIVLQTTPITVMAVGAVFVLSTAQIDLSIGAVVALSALVSASVLNSYGLIAGIAAGLATGAIVGAVNGILVTRFRLPSFLVTLGMTGLVAGIAQQITGLQAVPTLDTTFNTIFGAGTVFGVPSLVIWTIVVLIVGQYVYRHTRIGAHVLAVGDNIKSARVSGIRADRILLGVMILSGMCAALAGLLYTGRLHGASYTLGSSDQLTVIAAAVIGGTALFGGKGSIIGAFAGSLIFGMLNNGLILAGFSDAQQQIARGAIILIAVVLTLREKKS